MSLDERTDKLFRSASQLVIEGLGFDEQVRQTSKASEPCPSSSPQLLEPSLHSAPMLRQYLGLKAQYPDYALLFQVGDFYEVFFEDAPIVAQALDIRLTSRNKDQPDPVPMCGVPIASLENYLPKLLSKGIGCVVVSQTESSSAAKKGMVKREVTRVVTPGIRYEGDGLDERSFNFLAAICLGPRLSGALAYVDVSTGHLRLRRVDGVEDMKEALSRVQPSELLVPSTIFGTPVGKQNSWIGEAKALLKPRAAHIVSRPVPRVGAQEFNRRMQVLLSKTHGQTTQIPTLVAEEMGAVVCLLNYIEELSVGSPPLLSHLSLEEASAVVLIDAATLRNLEITETTFGGSRENSLLGQLDSTKTAMGARELRDWLLSPSSSIELINLRHDAVEELVSKPQLLISIRTALATVRDIERIGSRISTPRANPRDLFGLSESLVDLPQLKDFLSQFASSFMADMCTGFDTLEDVRRELSESLIEDPPVKVTEGGIFRQGYDAEIDELRDLSRDGKSWLLEFEARERKQTEIPVLKVRYNNVFGYFIEITNAHSAKVPSHYERKQTLVNAERFVTGELKEYEAKVLSAKVRQNEIEREKFAQLRESIAQRVPRIKSVANILARLDAICSFAHLSRDNRYVRPEMTQDPVIELSDARHPVVEQMVGVTNFVPNDVSLDVKQRRFAVLTGPNMGGKSTYLRQIGIIQLMAQAGCFVPAAKARIGLVDRIFTRIGSADDLTRGDSTFMVEMREASVIVRKA